MTAWPYVVPKFFGSPWDTPNRRALTSTSTEWPTVGIFCRHEPTPWLVGSFTLSAELLEERQERHWAWEKRYITGDGYVIRLERKSPRQASQNIVDDQEYDRAAEREQLAQLPLDDLSPEELEAIAKELSHADEVMRSRIIMECRLCDPHRRRRRVFRTDKAQAIVEAFWLAGLREVTFDMFSEAYGYLRGPA